MIRVSAPGKLMLAGEYTVASADGPALAVAVDRRLEVTIEVGGARWRVSSEGLRLNEADPEAVPLIARALSLVPGLPDAGHIRIQSDLGVGPDKPGLGGSAALCAAIHAGLHRVAGSDEGLSIGGAIDLHRSAQDGHGSGYDVATCITGGVTLFDRRHGAPTARRVGWPEGLYGDVFFTGHGASTVALLERVACWQAEDPDDMRAYLTPLAEETRELVDAWLIGDVPRILTAAAQVQEELDAFDRAGEIGIYGGGQMQLLAAIEDAGAVGRTSGAGGGDCLWALSSRPATLERARAAAEAVGFTRLDVGYPGDGLNFEAS